MIFVDMTPRYGESRIVKRFLLFPTKVGHIVRWLEYAYLYQTHHYCDWITEDWATKEEYEKYQETKRIKKEKTMNDFLDRMGA